MTTKRTELGAAYMALALSGLLWGSSFLLGKIALAGVDVSHMILYRFVIASVCFLPYLISTHPRLTRPEWGWIVLAGVIGVAVQFLLQFKGLSLTTVSHAALMVGMAPVLLAVAAFVVLRERAPATTWMAVAASTVGVSLIVLQNTTGPSDQHGGSLTGDLMVLASMFAAMVWILVSKKLMRRHSAATVSGLITVVGTIVLAAWVLTVNGPLPLHLASDVWWAIGTLGVICTVVTTVLWNWGLSHVQAGKAGVFINIEPLIGTLLGVWLLHDRLGWLAIAGGGLVVVASVAVTLHER